VAAQPHRDAGGIGVNRYSFSLQRFMRARNTCAMLCVALFYSLAHAAVPLPNVQLLTSDPGTGPADRDVPFLAWHEDLSLDGYVEQEILMSGEANTYVYTDEANQSTQVEVASSGHAYTTRVLLRHPANPDDFNGVVYLEILNATARYDGAPMWNLTYPSIIAKGAAWVGVTYSDTTARFMHDTWGKDAFPAPSGAEPRNRSRYATLNIATRAYTWDIVSQAAALLKANKKSSNPMKGFGVDTTIVTGYSQSARYVTTYANSFMPSFRANSKDRIVDGYIVAAGGPTASLLDGRGSHTLGDRRTFELSALKGVRFTTESDIKSVLVRQTKAERPRLRTYEAAGTSHVDLNGGIVGRGVSIYQFGNISSAGFGCVLPLNPLRTGTPLSAIQHRLAQWIEGKRQPPANRFIAYDADTNEWRRDADGNALGGIRPARIEVPLGAYTGSNLYEGPLPAVAAIFCGGIVGGFDAFPTDEVRRRYFTRRIYVLLTWWHLFAQYMDGFLLPSDAKAIMDEAKNYEGLPEQFYWLPRGGRGIR
jgi:hypothetical protein